MNKPLLGSDSESDDEGSSSTGGGVMGLGSLKNALNKLVPYGFDQHANLNEAFPWSIAALMRTTNNFTHENILGQGGSGIVYKGNFGNGNMIAVKRMQCRSGFEFESQLAVLQKVGHTQHLVALLGYCMDGNERIFVYEYMSQGSLSRHLFDSEAEPLGWDRRLLIALDVARAVDFLHTSGHIHGDLKPSNVLLQKDMSAKIADFGIAQHGKCSGAFGYLAPECTTGI